MPHFGIPPLVFTSLFLGISGVGGGGLAGWVVPCLKFDSMVRCEFACRYSWFKSQVKLVLKERVVLSRWGSEI